MGDYLATVHRLTRNAREASDHYHSEAEFDEELTQWFGRHRPTRLYAVGPEKDCKWLSAWIRTMRADHPESRGMLPDESVWANPLVEEFFELGGAEMQ